MGEKDTLILNENDFRDFIKECVAKSLFEYSKTSRTKYDDVMKERMAKSFETLESEIKDVIGMLTGWRMNTQGYSLSDYAKLFGYKKSSKRFMEALEHVEKAQKLINAAKNDMLDLYQAEPGNVSIPKLKDLPSEFEKKFTERI